MTNTNTASGAEDLIAALEDAQRAINSMKVEAETAAQGDEQMMLEACETISNEGLQADMAIRAALAQQPAPSAAPAEQRELCPSCSSSSIYACTCTWRGSPQADSQPVILHQEAARAMLKEMDMNDRVLAAIDADPKKCTAQVRCINGRITTESCTTKAPLISNGESSDGERDYYICPDCRKDITIDYREN